MKFTWPGFNEKRTVIIPLEWREFSFPKTPVRIDGEAFKPKGELHVTLIGKHHGGSMLEKIARDPNLEAQLGNAFQGIDWGYAQTGPVHLLARTRQRAKKKRGAITVTEKTIILRLSMPGTAEFYDYLGSTGLIAPGSPVPPPHFTLYTRNCPGGIGVTSDGLLDDLTSRQFTLDEFSGLCQQTRD